jgi:hypothetical protein
MSSSRLFVTRWSLRRSIALSFAAALSIVLSFATASATVVREVPIEQMTQDADAIVLGRVERTGVRMRVIEGRWVPFTVSEIRVLDALAGAARGEVIEVEEYGGIDPRTRRETRIAGSPRYRVGERVLLFLERVGAAGFRTYGMALGCFRVMPPDRSVGAERVRRDLGDVGLASWVSGSMQVGDGGAVEMPLGEFVAFVRSVLEQSRELEAPASVTGSVSGGGR